MTPAGTGSVNIVLLVTDARGAKVDQSYTLVIDAPEVNGPPRFESVPPLLALVGQLYSHELLTSDPNDDTLTYTLINGPTGMTIDSNSGLIEWTPAVASSGWETFRVQISDGYYLVSQTFQVRARSNSAAGDLFDQ
ncbi:MAG: Ig domain-containing protein [Planctomycetaceae bacterium]